MKTRTSPIDYEKRIMIVSQLERLCGVCGGFTTPRISDSVPACMSCGSTETVEVWEHMADTFRQGLMDHELDKALELATACAPQMDDFLDLIGIAMSRDGEIS